MTAKRLKTQIIMELQRNENSVKLRKLKVLGLVLKSCKLWLMSDCTYVQVFDILEHNLP